MVRELRGERDRLLSRLRQFRDDPEIDFADGHGFVGEFKPEAGVTAFIAVRCRQCPQCRAHRARLWTARAIDEVKSANRTWFGTLTLSPDYAFGFQMMAERSIRDRASKPYSELSADERTRAIGNAAGPELQRWLKRIRKNSGALVRYLLVCEAHKSGIPHWHLLMHEHDGQVGKRTLERAWRAGFSQFRLLDGAGGASYVCKYLSKGLLTRVRASARYGAGGPALLTERLLRDVGFDPTSRRLGGCAADSGSPQTQYNVAVPHDCTTNRGSLATHLAIKLDLDEYLNPVPNALEGGPCKVPEDARGNTHKERANVSAVRKRHPRGRARKQSAMDRPKPGGGDG